MTVAESGVHDWTPEVYERDPLTVPSLRSSTAWQLVAKGSTPRHAWHSHPRLNPNWKPENKRAFDLGKAAHRVLLGRGEEIKIIDFGDYRAKEARIARDAAYARGEIPVLAEEYETVQAMAKAAREQIAECVVAGAFDGNPFENGEAEKSIAWHDVGGVMCRARFDWLPSDCEHLLDYKTTAASADYRLWQWRQMRDSGLHFRVAFYRRGLEALGLANSPRYSFIVQENYEPFCLSVIHVDDELIEQANEEVMRAIKLWDKCLRTNSWPGYDPQGYVVGLSEREKMAQAAQAMGPSQHMSSEDIAASL